jgi:multidrug efflux system membrane fusion protein
LRQDHRLDAIAFDRSDTTQLETGLLTAADNQIDTTTGTDKLKAVFGNADEGLFPNQFVNVHLILEQRKNAIVVPAAAVQHGTDNDYVWLVKPATTSALPHQANESASGGKGAANKNGSSVGSGTVVMQPVDIDTTQGSMVILKSGLEANQEVVVDGADKLQNGSKVSTTAAVAHRIQKRQPQQQLGPT